VRIRAGLTVALLAVLLPGPLASSAEGPGPRSARIGFLGDAPPFLADAFRAGLRELGYVEGSNLVIEYRPAEWKNERLPELAADLVRLKVDVIVTANVRATEAARRATSTIPIVFTVSGDPVAEGIVSSLARPGGNLTGLATISPELVGKQIEMLRAVVPRLTRIAVLKNPAQSSHPRAVREAQAAARVLGIQVHVLEARTSPEIAAAFASMTAQRVEGLLVLRDAEFRAHRAEIVAHAARGRLPTMYGLREEAEAGGLMAYGASVPQLFRRAATYVDKILRGAKPGELPVEQPTTFELVINLKTAKTLGLVVPPSLLGQADDVIQ
jgi:putative ABC transport system substrate-binding protein